jgi:Kef-type K+ transport system membrane component KefB
VEVVGLVPLGILLVVAVSRVLRGVLDRARQPPVMAEVLAGILLGASVLGALPGDPSSALFTADAVAVLTVLGEIAVVAYLFTVGTGLDPRVVRREGAAVAAVGLGSFLVPWLAGAALALVIHDGVDGDPPLVPFALFLGAAVAVTAFPVLSRIIDARGLSTRPAGRVALAAAALQELLVWPALAVAVALSGRASAAPSTPLGVIGAGILALAFVLVSARVLAPAAAAGRASLAGPAALGLLGLSAVATELAGLHLVVGAFVFGAALPAGPRAAAAAVLRSRPATALSAALLPLFFALPALRVDLGALGADGWVLFAVVLAVAAASKLLSAGIAARLSGLAPGEAMTVGALMNARGLVELVVLAVGLEAGLVDERLFAVMVLMALTTTFATGPLVDRIGRLGAPAVPHEPLAVSRGAERRSRAPEPVDAG